MSNVCIQPFIHKINFYQTRTLQKTAAEHAPEWLMYLHENCVFVLLGQTIQDSWTHTQMNMHTKALLCSVCVYVCV